MSPRWATLAAMNALLSVAAGAFGAHGLRARLSEHMLTNWEIAARYQMYHALGLFVVASLVAQKGDVAEPAGWSMLVGIVLFSGSLYAMALTGATKLGVITPLGGLGFLIGWALVARAATR
jgi:uncharacterized membrane protein YgdD (TMEM256/DUF423 family)